LEDNLSVSNKIKYIFTIEFSNCTLWYLPIWVKTLCSHRNLYMDIYRYIYSSQELVATRMSFSRWRIYWGPCRQCSIIQC
jgi:hypothetical protein